MNIFEIKRLWRSLMVLATASVFGLFMSTAQAQDDTTDDTCTGTTEECAAETDVETTDEEGAQPDNTGKAVSEAAKGMKDSEDPSTDAKALKDTAMENLPEQANRPDKPETPVVPDRPDLPEKAEVPDRPERPEVPGRPENPGKP